MTAVFKTWMYTLNNYTETDIIKFEELDGISRHICGKEIAPTTGTKHLQGRITFKKAMRLSGVKKIHSKAHWTGARFQKSDYESKGGDIVIDICNDEQGKRTDLDIVADMVIRGHSQREIARECPGTFMKYHKGLNALRSALIEPRDEPPEVIVICGLTGTGKSRRAREIVENPFYVWGPENGKWFDGYQGQKHVIFEEFRGQLPFGMMLRLLDRYDCKVEYKGGICEFVATKIVITSPKPPSGWYSLEEREGALDQLLRRITEVIYL